MILDSLKDEGVECGELAGARGEAEVRSNWRDITFGQVDLSLAKNEANRWSCVKFNVPSY
jgi:hypothetical protein